MKAVNENIVVTVTEYNGTDTPDKNGKMPVMLQCIAGKMPNRNVLSGTVAEQAGFKVGHTYLAQVREQGTDLTFGRQFTFLKLCELNGLEIIQATQALSDPQVFEIPKPEGFEDAYTRKSNAVESLQAQRIKEGKFIPVNKLSFSNHETAYEIIAGSTTSNKEKAEIADAELEEVFNKTKKQA